MKESCRRFLSQNLSLAQVLGASSNAVLRQPPTAVIIATQSCPHITSAFSDFVAQMRSCHCDCQGARGVHGRFMSTIKSGIEHGLLISTRLWSLGHTKYPMDCTSEKHCARSSRTQYPRTMLGKLALSRTLQSSQAKRGLRRVVCAQIVKSSWTPTWRYSKIRAVVVIRASCRVGHRKESDREISGREYLP